MFSGYDKDEPILICTYTFFRNANQGLDMLSLFLYVYFRGSNNTNAKQRLLDNTETLERSGRKLEQGEAMLAETEQVGSGVLSDLAYQREVLSRSRNRLRDTDQDLGTSSRILSTMIVRIQKSKIVLALVGVAIVGSIILFVYLSFEG